MKIVFPITKADGKEFKDNADIEGVLSQESIGQFGYNPSNRSWHGGIHISDKSAPWAVDKFPVRAIAQGRVVACRIGSKYQKSIFLERELTFSNDFCLIEHSYCPKNAVDGAEDIFTFYSLYMHLRPQLNLISGEKVEIPGKKFKLQYENRNVRNKLSKNGQKKQVINANSILELIETTSAQKINGYTYCKFKIIDNKDTIAKDIYKDDPDFFVGNGKEIWLALEVTKNSNSLVVDEITEYTLKSPVSVSASAGSAEGTIDLKKGCILKLNESLDKKEISSVTYKAYIVVDNQGESNHTVSVGNTIWLKDEPQKLQKIEPAIEPDWFYEKYEGLITDNNVVCYSDPSSSNIGESLGILPSGTKFSYEKTTNTYGLYGTDNILMARVTFTKGTVNTLDDQGRLSGNSVSVGWIKITEKNVIYTSKMPCELDKINSFGKQSPYLIDATEPVGYLGEYDVIDPDGSNKFKQRMMVHLEQFSLEKPTDAFLSEIFQEGDLISFVIDEDSDGFIDEYADIPPPLLIKLADSVTIDSSVSGVKTCDLVSMVNSWDSNKYTAIKHKSEWFSKSGELKIWDELKANYEHQLMDYIIAHEKERVDRLVWMQDELKIGFTPSVWNWWPVINSIKFNWDHFISVYEPLHSVWDEKNQVFLKLKLNNQSKNNLKKLVNELVCDPHNFTKEQIAYILATAKLESYNYKKGIFFYPISELGGDRYAERLYDIKYNKRKALELGNVNEGDGVKFKGRGFVQITGRNNYHKFSNILNIDLENNPNFAVTWDTAYKIATIGIFDGIFTGYKLTDFINKNKTDYFNARKIINRLDKANVVSRYSEEFYKCLKKSM